MRGKRARKIRKIIAKKAAKKKRRAVRKILVKAARNAIGGDRIA